MAKELASRQALGIYDSSLDNIEQKAIEEQSQKIEKAVNSIYDFKNNFTLFKYSSTDELHGDYMVYEVVHSNGKREPISRELFVALKGICSNE